MGQALRNPGYFTVDDYLAHEQRTGERCEYVNGVIYAMTGGTDRHNLITGNVFFALRGQMKSPCQVFQADMKVRVRTDIGEARYYPDVFAGCDDTDRDRLFRENPCVIVEVLSPSTEPNDRLIKFEHYRLMTTLDHYILVAQDVPQVEVFARDKGWKPEILSWGDAVNVCGGRAKLTVDDIYENIPFTGLKPGDFG